MYMGLQRWGGRNKIIENRIGDPLIVDCDGGKLEAEVAEESKGA